jgi:hypothetical protein
MRLQQILVGLQSFQVAILLLHDWVPLAPLNDVRAARRGHPLKLIFLATVVSSLLPSIGLVLSLWYLKSGWPSWLYLYLSAAYGFLFAGELEAWWVPYLLWPQPKRGTQYEEMYGNTWAFLPPHKWNPNQRTPLSIACRHAGHVTGFGISLCAWDVGRMV